MQSEGSRGRARQRTDEIVHGVTRGANQQELGPARERADELTGEVQALGR